MMMRSAARAGCDKSHWQADLRPSLASPSDLCGLTDPGTIALSSEPSAQSVRPVGSQVQQGHARCG